MTSSFVIRLSTAVGALLLAIPAAAQDEAQSWLRNCEREAARGDRATVCELRTATGSLRGGLLDVDAGPNGGIVVRGGNVPGVQITAAVKARAETDRAAEGVARGIRLDIAPGRVRADGPATERGESWSVTYYITVPRQVDLELVSVNGPVAVSNVSGRIRASTTNGPLALDGLAGDVHGRTSNGPLSVALRGSRWDGAGLDAETVNGPVTVTVPDGYSAQFEGGTHNGPVNLGFPVKITTFGRGSSRFETTLGQGGAPVRVVTANGPYITNRR